MRNAWAVVSLALCAALAGVAAPQTQPKPAAVVAPAKKTPSKLSDGQIEAAIRAKFAKSKINEDKFQVRVQGGVAIIDGHTEVIQNKGVATRMAKTAGAVAVKNQIVSSDAAKAKAAGNLEKGRRVQLKRSEPRSER